MGKETTMGDNIQLSRELGFLRIGAALPLLRVADVDFNVKAIINTVRKARNQGVQLLTFPEMAITGYTIGDLVQHQALLVKAQKGLGEILKESVMSLSFLPVERVKGFEPSTSCLGSCPETS